MANCTTFPAGPWNHSGPIRPTRACHSTRPKVVQFATLGLLDFVLSLFGAYVLTLTLAALAWLAGLIPCVWLGRPRRQAFGYYLFGGALWAGAIAALPLAFPLTALIEVGLGG